MMVGNKKSISSHPRAISLEDRSVIILEGMREKKIAPWKFRTCLTVARRIVEEGYVYYKDLPNQLEALMHIYGVGSRKIELFFDHICRKVQDEKEL
jgi:hypothetical protein